MVKRFLIVFSVVFFANLIFAQQKTFSLSLYYTVNQTSSEANFKIIDSVLSTINTGTTEVSIFGYADYLNSDAYNLSLSQRRAEIIKKYIVQHINGKNISVVSCEGFGEKHSTNRIDKAGEAAQRRVDVIFTHRTPVKKIGRRDNVIQEETLKKAEPEVKAAKIMSEKIKLEDLEKGETLAIQGLSFIPGRHVLIRSAIPVLEDLLKTLKEHPELKIEIQGHSCCVGPEEPDGVDLDTGEKNLSESRAKTVYTYLVRNGINSGRLAYKGYGHKNPKIEIERSPDDEQVNRRVEIKILEN